MKNKINLIVRLLIAILFVQTLFYKFSGHPDSIYIFSKVGLEPAGRIGIGVLELLASLLLLNRKYVWAGALLAVGILFGAIAMHLTTLGIEIHNDNGKLFYMAITLFILSLYVLYTYRRSIPWIGKRS